MRYQNMSLKDFTDYYCDDKIFILFAVHILRGCDSLENFMNCIFTLGYVKIFWGWDFDKASSWPEVHKEKARLLDE